MKKIALAGTSIKHITLLATLLFSTLTGCVSSGREIKSDQLTNFTKGKTTIADVTSALGKPTTTTTTSDGRRRVNYAFVHAQARPETYIPFIGGLVGGADVRSSMVDFTFDKNGILEDYTQSESNSGTGMGLSGGEYRAPDRTLPQEQPK